MKYQKFDNLIISIRNRYFVQLKKFCDVSPLIRVNQKETYRNKGWQPSLEILEKLPKDPYGNTYTLERLIRHDLGEAQSLFKNVLRKEYPNEMGMWERWALLEWQAGNVQLARDLFRKAIRSSNRNTRGSSIWQVWGEMELKERNFNVAISYFNIALTSNPLSIDSLLGLARVEIELRNTSKARDLLEKGYTMNPLHRRLISVWAKFEINEQNDEFARTLFQKAERANNLSVPLIHQWGSLEFKLGNYQEALRIFILANQKQQAFSQVLLSEEETSSEVMASSEEVMASSEEVMASSSSISTVHCLLGAANCLQLLNRNEEARELFRQALLDAKSCRLRYAILCGWGDMEKKYGDLEDAKALYSEAIHVDSDIVVKASDLSRGIASLAFAEIQSNNLKQAKQIVVEFLERFPQGTSEVYYTLGVIEEVSKNIPKAIASFRQGIECDPTNDKNWYKYGMLELRLGHSHSAKIIFQQALQHCGEKPELLRELACIEDRFFDPDKAIDFIQRAIDLNKSHGDYWQVLVQFQLRRHDPELAISILDEALKHIQNNDTTSRSHIYRLYGKALATLKEMDSATEMFLEAISLHQYNYRSRIDYAVNILAPQRRINEAIHQCEQALLVAPKYKHHSINTLLNKFNTQLL